MNTAVQRHPPRVCGRACDGTAGHGRIEELPRGQRMPSALAAPSPGAPLNAGHLQHDAAAAVDGRRVLGQAMILVRCRAEAAAEVNQGSCPSSSPWTPSASAVRRWRRRSPPGELRPPRRMPPQRRRRRPRRRQSAYVYDVDAPRRRVGHDEQSSSCGRTFEIYDSQTSDAGGTAPFFPRQRRRSVWISRRSPSAPVDDEAARSRARWRRRLRAR